MGVYEKPGSPYWWMLLEGHGATRANGTHTPKRESTGIRRDAPSAATRKDLRSEAEQVYHARMVQLARGRVGLPVDTGRTFTDQARWFATHHTAKRKSQTSVDRETDIIARLVDHFGSTPLRDIRPARWQEYETTRMNGGVALNTVGRELAVMKSILVSAVGDHLEVSPLAHVQRKSTKVPPKRTITAADEKRLIIALSPGKVRGGTFGADDELLDLYLLGVGTLLRQQNLIDLQRQQFHAGRLVVVTKTGPHAIALDGPTTLQRRCLAILKRRMPTTPQGYFFPKWQARFARYRNAANAKFLQTFRRACRRAGIPWGLKNHGVVWHTATRASGATRMIREHGVDVRTVQLLGGWRSLDQMAEYLGIDLGSVSAAAAKGKRKTA